MSGSTPAPTDDPFATIEPAALATAARGMPTVATRPNGPRTPARSAVRIVFGSLGAAVLLGAIVITIRHRDGSIWKIVAPGGSEITITPDDKHERAPTLPPAPAPDPRPKSRPPAKWPADAPKPAVSPFDAAQARRHQEQWAEYLKAPVEYTNLVGMRFRLIPPGEYQRGSTPRQIAGLIRHGVPEDADWPEYGANEGPVHAVILTRPIYLGATEVTQSQFRKITGKSPSTFASTGVNRTKAVLVDGMNTAEFPVEGVTWHDAVDFCIRLSRDERLAPACARDGDQVTLRVGPGYRLPTEAEWEHACRAGTTTAYWFGDDEAELHKAAWHAANAGDRTHAVAGLRANPFGLYDVCGNVWEWVHDVFDAASYRPFGDRPAVDPQGPPGGTSRGIRGGYWGRSAPYCRSALRAGSGPTTGGDGVGFRVVLAVDGVRQALNVRGPPIP